MHDRIISEHVKLIKSKFPIPINCLIRNNLIIHTKSGTTRTFVPPTLRTHILSFLHESNSPLPIRAIQTNLSKLFYWPTINTDISLYLNHTIRAESSDEPKESGLIPTIVNNLSNLFSPFWL